MRSPSFRRFALPLFLLLASATFSQAAVQSRISTVNSASRVSMEHTVSPRALAATDLGAAPADRKLDSMTLIFNRSAAQQAALDQLLIDQQDPSSARYHQWLTPEQFGAQFGLSASDLAKVSTWLTSQGFTITSTGRGSSFISFSGTASQVQQAFATNIHSVIVDGETHIANITNASLPAGIASVVAGFTGLDDIKLKPRSRISHVAAPAVESNAVHPQFTSSTSGSHYIAPGDFYKIYNVTPLLNSSINGAGVKIAVVGQTNISLSDVAAFRTASGLCTTVSTTCPAPVPTVQLYGTSPGTSSSDIDEAQLDVEWAGAVAPGATILYVNSTNVFNTSLVQAINNNLAPIISISYGLCESSAGPTSLASFNQLFQQANAQGQTISGPSGDSGATDCDYGSYPAYLGLAVDFPASSPNVTAVGGSMFNEGTTTGATTYWNASTAADAFGGTAIGYIPEAVWNETSSTSGLAAGGGGASSFFGKPSWQIGTGVPTDSVRDVPDLSLNAASGHDGYLFCSQGSCVNGFRTAAGNLAVVGGTSVGAPSFAGILALIEQKIGSKIGNANPTIYGLANGVQSAIIFHDVYTGSNSSPCIAGTPNCLSGGTIGYSATTGYDLATGWGSVDVGNMATYWTSVTPAGVITATTKTNAAVAVITSTSICALSGGSITLNVAVTNGLSGNTAVPTGTVQVMIDGTAVGAPVVLTNGSANGIVVSTAALASGSHIVSALYSGDATFFSAKGTLLASGLQTPIDVISSTSADFSITPCTASVTVVHGATAAGLVLTLTPFKGYTGNVTVALNSGDSVAASYQFSSTTVALTSTSPATTTLTLSAFQSNSQTATGNLRVNTSTNRQPFGHVPWYASTSGATVACLLLISLPRRRRLGGLLAVLLSVAALGAVGCGSSSNSGTGTTTTTGTTAATPGTYTLIVTATGTGGQVHSTNVTFTVQ